MNKVYPCSILPADGLQVVEDGRNLRARIQFGSGTGHSTPVLLPEEQALQLAHDIAVWSARRNANAKHTEWVCNHVLSVYNGLHQLRSPFL